MRNLSQLGRAPHKQLRDFSYELITPASLCNVKIAIRKDFTLF